MTDRIRFSPWSAALAVTALYFVAVFAGVLHHELWLDEAHHWLLGQYSHSIAALVHNARYEGHPLLWNLLLFFLARFTSDPFAMQVLNVLIASAAVLLLLRFAPFPFYQRVLLAFSYYVFYEYGVISRNYALIFLLLAVVCVMYRQRRQFFLLFSFVLLLLANTHLFAAVAATGIFLVQVFERFYSAEGKSFRGFVPGVVLFGAGLLLVVYQAWPQPDHFLYTYNDLPLFSFKRIGKALSTAWKGFFPLQDFGDSSPWNTNFAVGLSKKAAVVPAILAWFVPFLLLRKRVSLFLFWFAAILAVIFMYVSPLIVAARHCGFLFLLLISVLWIASFYPDETFRQDSLLARFHKRTEKWRRPLWLVLLLVQLPGSVFMYVTDWNRPFSQGKAVAAFIAEDSRRGELVVLGAHYVGPPVVAYLGREAYYPENERMGSFCLWNTSPFMIQQDTLLPRCHRLLESSGRDSLLLVTSWPVEEKMLRQENAGEWSLQLLAEFGGSLVKAENYWVYELKKRNPIIP